MLQSYPPNTVITVTYWDDAGQGSVQGWGCASTPMDAPTSVHTQPCSSCCLALVRHLPTALPALANYVAGASFIYFLRVRAPFPPIIGPKAVTYPDIDQTHLTSAR